MESNSLKAIQTAISSDPSKVTAFISASESDRTQIIQDINSQSSAGLSTAEVAELAADPQALLEGVELPDDVLGSVAGAGKGDSNIEIGGDVNNSKVHSGGGGTSTKADTDVSVKK